MADKSRKKTAKKDEKPKADAAKREAALRVIEAVRHDVRTRRALEENGLAWDEFNKMMLADPELKQAWSEARTSIEELWKIEKREQLHDAAMGRLPKQAMTPRGDVVTLYSADISALIRGIDQDSPRPKPVDTDADAAALTAFQAALKLHAEVIGKKGGAGK